MGMLIWTGRELQDTLLLSGKGAFDVFLCCPGPSLKQLDRDLRGPGRMVIAVNTAYPRVKPDAWIGMDAPPCYSHNIWHEPFPKITGSKFAESCVDGQPIKLFPNTYFTTGVDCLPWEIFQHVDPASPLIWQVKQPNTFYTALHLAVRMGAKRIFFVGTDFGGAGDYHDGRTLSDEHRRRNHKLYGSIVDLMPMLYVTAKHYGVELLSCTPGSPINEDAGGVVPCVTIDEAVKLSDTHASAMSGGVLDAAEADLCEWTAEKPVAPNGVMVALDRNMEWLLDWWWSNYARHNSYPVCFVDYGLSDAGRKWCVQHGAYMMSIKTIKAIEHVWFRKPFALLNSPFERTAYIEPDCEVKGNVGGIFDACQKGLALTIDPYNPWSKQYLDPPLATGVIGVQRHDGLVCAWSEAILRAGAEKGYRSDQEALNHVVSVVGKQGVVIMPKEYQWLRLDGADDGKAIVYHWTGPQGKDAIRAKIGLPVEKQDAIIIANCPACGCDAAWREQDHIHCPHCGKDSTQGAAATTPPATGDMPKDVAAGPLVSIVMAAYNAQKYIGAAIESVQAQSYRNWELIVVDDGSTDDTNIMVRACDLDKRIRLITLPKNIGQYQALNHALDAIGGKYVCRLDSDDVLPVDSIAARVEAMERTGCDVATTDSLWMDERGGPLSVAATGAMDFDRYGVDAGYRAPHSGTEIVRREVVDAVGKWSDEFKLAGDSEWNFKARSAGFTNWTHIGLPLYHYRRRPDSLIARYHSEAFVEFRAMAKKYRTEGAVCVA